MTPRTALPLFLALLSAPLLAGAAPASVTAIGHVQGDGARSPLEGRTVTVQGVVTADFRDGLGGFFLQDGGDGDPRTSDAVFVPIANDASAEGSGLPQVGRAYRIEGTVTELALGSHGSLLTAIVPARIEALAGRAPAVRPLTLTARPTDWEAFEGMKVRIAAPLTVTGTESLARFGELAVSFGGRLWQPSELARPGSADYRRIEADNAHRRLLLDDGSGQRDPAQVAYLAGKSAPRTGTVLRNVEGIVDARQGQWRLQLTRPLAPSAPQRPAPPRVKGALKVAAFNLENLFNGDGHGGGFPTARGAKTEAQWRAQLSKLVATVRGLDPDIAALMELENDGYGPSSSLAQFVDALNAAGGDWRFVDAGHGPGPDTIRVGLIYRAGRVQPLGAPAVLEGGPFGERSRVPLAQAFVRNGAHASTPVVVVANHFKSKGCSEATGADADQRDGQGCWNALRTDSARRLDAWLRTDPTGTGSDRVVLLGDFNAYAMEDPMQVLRDAGWIDAFAAAKVQQPYSYVYNGLSGRLDHALLSPPLARKLRGAAEWHINADEPDSEGYADGDASVPWRSSDHDPLVVGFDL